MMMMVVVTTLCYVRLSMAGNSLQLKSIVQ